MEGGGLVKTETSKGVQQLVGFDALHSDLVSFDVDSMVAPPDGDDDDDDAGVIVTNAAPRFSVPKSGSKKIEISIKTVRGNKNVTLIKNLEPFGIKLDEALRSKMAKTFSVAVSYSDDPNKKLGQTVTLQGKYATQAERFLAAEFGIPKGYFQTNATKQTKKDKGINVA